MPGPQIAVIGLGAAGSAALCQLARRGARATGIEQFSLGHDRGSSHGATRMIRLAHFENSSYVPLLRRAYALWRELEITTGQRLVVTTGIAEIGSPQGELVRGTLAAASRYGLAHDLLDAKSLTRRYPRFKLPDTFVAVLQPDGGYIEAAAAMDASIRLATEAGAVVRSGEKVLAIEPRAAGVRITTDRAEIEADGAIVAAGPWMRSLMPELRLPLRVTRQVVGWFEPDDAAQFAPDRFPVFILETEYGHHYGLPAYGRMGVKVAKHHHRQETVEPDAYDRTVSAMDEAAIRAPLAAHLPAANGRLLSAQTCLYTMTPDETFIIDAMPGYRHVVIASPCCGHGFKFSPVVGEILADLAARGTTEHDISPFRLQRFA
jgi:sarcosine oxidase